MARFSAREIAAIRAIERELSTIVTGAPFVLEAIAAPIRELLQTEVSCSYALAPQGDRLAIEYFYGDRFPDPVRGERTFNEYLQRSLIGWGAYNPVRPEREQRNRALGTPDLDDPAPATQHRQLFVRMGIGGKHQLRALVCEGPSLLAWVGAFQDEPFDTRQKRLLQRLVPALQRRLSLERKLSRVTLLDAAFSGAFNAIGSAAFLITKTGRIVEMNSLGTLLHAGDRRRVAAALVECARRPDRSSGFVVTRIGARGCPEHFLVVARADATLEVQHRSASAARRCGLTARQEEVLALVAQGLTNRVIAATLGVAERTVEVHLTAIFGKAQVESRAELVAKIWHG